jgi:sulfite reductase alpha subunit-like flavoprotein
MEVMHTTVLMRPQFFDWATSEAATLTAPIDYAVFGLGSKKTHAARFCLVGKRIDAELERLGGRRVYPRVDGDDSDAIEVQFDEWQRDLLRSLQEGASVVLITVLYSLSFLKASQ